MRKFLTVAAAAATLATIGAPAQAAIIFSGDHSVTVNQAEPGLVLQTQEMAATLNFALDLGETATIQEAEDVLHTFLLERVPDICAKYRANRG